MASITNINLKRCWRVESTFMRKDNLGFFFPPATLSGGSLGAAMRLVFRLKGRLRTCSTIIPE